MPEPTELGVNLPLISHIEGNLYVGGWLPHARLEPRLDHVVSLSRTSHYTIPFIDLSTKSWLYPLIDGDYVSEHTVRKAAAKVVECLAEGPTLVHCQAGLNRSGLVAGTALVMRGMTAEDAIALLREKRDPHMLCNQTFERWLRAFLPS